MNLYPFMLQKVILPMTDLVLGTKYRYYMKLFSSMEKASIEDIVAWQNKKLQALVAHVHANVPFYRDFMKENGLLPEDVRTQDDLSVFPVLDKQVIKDQYKKFIPDNLGRIKHFLARTGGSTGEPLQYYMANETQSAMWAKRIRVLRKFGFHAGEKYLALGSSSIIPDAKSSGKSTMFHQLLRMISLSAANMDAAKCEAAVDLLQRHKIRMIYGYASAIYLLAKYVLDHGVDLHVAVCMTTAEKLTTHYEQIIRRAFGCNVINEYGAREGGLYSYRCENGSFHMIETCLFRLAETSATTGTILTTSLINYAMPFINYNVEDVITIQDKKCGCGDNSFVFDDLVGRESQIMTMANGRTVTGPAFTVLFSGLPVECYQIVKVGGCVLEVRIQKGNDYSPDTERVILKSLKTHAGEDCNVFFNYNHVFVPLKNGKRDYFVTN